MWGCCLNRAVSPYFLTMNIPLFENKNSYPYHLFKKLKRMPTIDEMARGLFGDVRKVLWRRCHELRNENAYTNKGYTKSRVMRQIAEIPFDMLVHPEYKKYVNAGGKDKHENRKD